jgi:hypothetical protein
MLVCAGTLLDHHVIPVLAGMFFGTASSLHSHVGSKVLEESSMVVGSNIDSKSIIVMTATLKKLLPSYFVLRIHGEVMHA